MIINKDCRFFRGDIPCILHKKEGVHCNDCESYQPIKEKILIIKLGAMGDVVRTTPLLERLKKEYPNCYIYWLSLTPQILPDPVDKKMKFQLKNILILENINFDILINLDKDPEACALASKIKANKKIGYTLENGIPVPVNELANHKYYTGIFDDVSQQNRKSYPEEIFEICGYEFQGEKYQISRDKTNYNWNIDAKKRVVGLNTGCGIRWSSRLWPEEYWIELAKKLIADDYEVVLLGGPDEHEKNSRIQKECSAKYFGHFPLTKFINLLDHCDLIVTAVTMATHLTIALEKKIVLFNNVFNKHEFELYGLGKILEPKNCTCYYKAQCDKGCMREITVEKVIDTISDLLNSRK